MSSLSTACLPVLISVLLQKSKCFYQNPSFCSWSCQPGLCWHWQVHKSPRSKPAIKCRRVSWWLYLCTGKSMGINQYQKKNPKTLETICQMTAFPGFPSSLSYWKSLCNTHPYMLVKYLPISLVYFKDFTFL